MTNPLVSIVIPTFNRSALLKEAIESVMRQNYRPLELIIVDDASTDSTSDMLQALKPRLVEIGISLFIVTHSINRGCGASLHTGFTLSKGKFISYLASDDRLVDSDKTLEQVRVMDDTQADWSYYRDFYVGKTAAKSQVFQPSFVPWFPYLNGVIEVRPRLRLLFLFWRNPINSSSLMIRREVYDEYGGWYNWTVNADCDGLLLMKYSVLGLKCAVLRGAPIFYRLHKGQVCNDSLAMMSGKAATRDYTLDILRDNGASRGYIALARVFRWLGR